MKKLAISILMIMLMASSVLAGVTITDTSTGRTISAATIWDALKSWLAGGVTGAAVGGAVGGQQPGAVFEAVIPPGRIPTVLNLLTSLGATGVPAVGRGQNALYITLTEAPGITSCNLNSLGTGTFSVFNTEFYTLPPQTQTIQCTGTFNFESEPVDPVMLLNKQRVSMAVGTHLVGETVLVIGDPGAVTGAVIKDSFALGVTGFTAQQQRVTIEDGNVIALEVEQGKTSTPPLVH